MHLTVVKVKSLRGLGEMGVAKTEIKAVEGELRMCGMRLVQVYQNCRLNCKLSCYAALDSSF